MRLPIATKAAKGRSIPLTAELLVNMYAEQAPSGAKSQVVAHGIPGYSLFADVSTEKPRGFHKTINDGKVYAVIGQSLYNIDSDGSSSNLGTIAGSGLVSMASSASELCIVAGSTGYTYNSTEGLEKITDSAFPGANTVTFIDGYFVFNNRQNAQKDQFFISDLRDGETYDASEFATAERYPDNLVRVFADHSELLLFGTDSIEIWFNAGNADFPFARAQGSVIEQGLGATYSVQKVDESVLWLDNEGIVRRLEGSTPVRISDHSIEYQISLGDWENAYSWTYVQEGHQFYVLTIPAATTSQTAGTYVFDAATRLWHKRKSYEKDFYRLGFYVRAFGKHLAMDSEAGKIYDLSLDTYQENGDPLISEIHFPQVQNDGDRFVVHKFQLDAEAGNPAFRTTGTTSPDLGSDPVYTGRSLAVTAQDSTPTDAVFSPGGIYLYVVGRASDAVHQYELTDAWDVDTATYMDRSLSVSSETGEPTGICFSGDGTKMYLVANSPDSIFQYSLSTAWNIATVSYDDVSINLGSQESEPSGIAIKSDGSSIFIVGRQTDRVREYTMSTVYDLSTAAYSGNSFYIGDEEISPSGLIFNGDGSRLFVAGNNSNTIFQYNLSTSWDITTATYSGNGYPVTAQSNSLSDLSLSPDGLRYYVVDSDNDKIFQYKGTPITVEPAEAVDPKIMLRVSGDTRTTGFTEPTRSMGLVGEYSKRMIWRRLGQYRTFTPIVRISDPVRRAVFTAYVDIEPCDG